MLVNIVMEKTWAGMFVGTRDGWASGLLAVGMANWGLVAGRSQSYEPTEGMWKEIDLIKRFNKLADESHNH